MLLFTVKVEETYEECSSDCHSQPFRIFTSFQDAKAEFRSAVEKLKSFWRL
jgi:hypothetical protein